MHFVRSLFPTYARVLTKMVAFEQLAEIDGVGFCRINEKTTALGNTSFKFERNFASASGCITAFPVARRPSFCTFLLTLLASLGRFGRLNSIFAIRAGSTYMHTSQYTH